MIKTIILLAIGLAISSVFRAQSFDLNWSDQYEYDNAKGGFFSEFIDVNSKYLYAKYSNLTKKNKNRGIDKKIRIVAFDKITMKEVASRPIKGFKANAANKQKYSKLSYLQTTVFEETVFVFWHEKNGDRETIYAESFSANTLQQINELKKIYSVSIDDDRSKRSRALMVLSNKKLNGKFVIGAEKTIRDERVEFTYVTMDDALSFTGESKVDLPLIAIGKFKGSATIYHLGDDGNIFAQSTVSMDKEERKNAPKGTSSSYSILSIIQTESGEIESFTMKFDDKNIFNFGYMVDNKGMVKVYGFFCDLEKDPSGYRIHGIFYALLDSEILDTKNMNFSYFDKEALDELFERDDVVASNSNLKNKKSNEVKNEQDQESLQGNYQIEKAISVENNQIVLFCSLMSNYVIENCTYDSKGNRNCTTKSYCSKTNVTAFKIDKEGEIVWASNINRYNRYEGWNIYDLEVAYKNDKFYVIYGIKSTSKKRLERIEVKSSFSYGVFDNKTGEKTRETFTYTNDPQINKRKRKNLGAATLAVFENNFYLNSQNLGYKPATIAVCAVSLVCWPAILFTNNPGLLKANAHLGKLEPIE